MVASVAAGNVVVAPMDAMVSLHSDISAVAWAL